MLKVSQLMRVNAYKPKGDSRNLSLVGQIRQVVFSPAGDCVEGFLIRQPDVAGMVKREDAFLARDSFDVCDAGLVATRGKESWDDEARARLIGRPRRRS